MAAEAKPPLPTQHVDDLALAGLPPESRHHLWVNLTQNALGLPIAVPVIVLRGRQPGPVLGITAAIHGDELNGVHTLHGLLKTLDPRAMLGTLVAVPISNVTAYFDNARTHRDGQDLNRIMPGVDDGNEGEVYAHRFMARIASPLDVLLDLHTASFGRANSFYLRADLNHPLVAELSPLLGVDIVVQVAPAQGTLRAAATQLGIAALTVEVGDANRFQHALTDSAVRGLRAVMIHLGMLPDLPLELPQPPVICSRSFWLYTDRGGILEVFPALAARVEQGEVIARLADPFDTTLRTYHAPCAGVVVGKSINPVAHTGARILHLGIVAPS